MEVHVLVYEHEHGVEVSVHVSEPAALAAAARIAREHWREARARQRSLPAEPPSSDAEAMELYFWALEDRESAQIVSCELGAPVQRPVPDGAPEDLDAETLRAEAERVIGEDRLPATELWRLVTEYGAGEGEDAGPYALVVVLGAPSPEDAWTFVQRRLAAPQPEGVDTHYVGAPWSGVPDLAGEIATEAISLRITPPSGSPAGQRTVALEPCE